MGREQPEKFSALYHGGLEVVPPSEAPQVVDDEALPEVGIKKRSSELKPELVPTTAYYGNATEVDWDAEAPEHDPRADHSRTAQDGNTADTEKEPGDRRERRYCCGMTRRMMIVLVVVLILIVVVGVVLGGTLGSLLNKT